MDAVDKEQYCRKKYFAKRIRRICSYCSTLVRSDVPSLPCCAAPARHFSDRRALGTADRAGDGCGGPRYCGSSCQRQHWLAGHKDECDCADGDETA